MVRRVSGWWRTFQVLVVVVALGLAVWLGYWVVESLKEATPAGRVEGVEDDLSELEARVLVLEAEERASVWASVLKWAIVALALSAPVTAWLMSRQRRKRHITVEQAREKAVEIVDRMGLRRNPDVMAEVESVHLVSGLGPYYIVGVPLYTRDSSGVMKGSEVKWILMWSEEPDLFRVEGFEVGTNRDTVYDWLYQNKERRLWTLAGDSEIEREILHEKIRTLKNSQDELFGDGGL